MVAATKLGVTPCQIAEAKEIATNLCRAAFAPQEVRQPDGSALELCLRGRLTRAYLLAGEAQREGDEARVARLRAGIEQLAAQVQRAEAEAQRAASDYAGPCAAPGMEPEDVYPPKCGCEGCRAGGRRRISQRDGAASRSVQAAAAAGGARRAAAADGAAGRRRRR